MKTRANGSATESDELHGAEAIEFAQRKLREVRVDSERWEVEYVDEVSDERWLLDYPHSGEQGGGSPRLRRIRS
jgi:hypothetical protein